MEVPLAANCSRLPNDPNKIVCTCTESSCDELKFDWPTKSGEARLIETTRSGLRFRETHLAIVSTSIGSEDKSLSRLSVNLNKEHQTILGFGGAFTDAAAINIHSLSATLGGKLLESYFGPNGLQYTFGRVPIAGSDFSTRAYSYDDANFPDYDLKEWRLAPEDVKHKIPIIRRAIELVADSGAELRLLASPWSPPKWMKTNHDFSRGHLIDEDKIYMSYANYLVGFFEAYKAYGIKFWGATVQNEPLAAYLPFYFFNSLQMSHQEAAKFIGSYLGPALEAKGYTKKNFKLLVGDDSLLFLSQQVPALLANATVQKYVSGLAFHWYTSGFLSPYSTLSRLVESVKGKIDHVIMTEACTGSMTLWSMHVDLGSWDRGEAYAVDIIEDMQRQTGAWIDWNLALDEKGGPNWAHNFVDSPIIVNKAKNEFYKQPMYYVLAHFSRFFRPNTIRVDSELTNPGYFEKIMILAAHNKQTGHVVVNILNKSTYARKLRLEIKFDGHLQELGPIEVEGKSINTVVLKL